MTYEHELPRCRKTGKYFNVDNTLSIEKNEKKKQKLKTVDL